MTVYFIAKEGGRVYQPNGAFTVDWLNVTPWNFTDYALKTKRQAENVVERRNLEARIVPRTIEFDV